MDVQSGAYIGVKIHYSKNINFNGVVSNNGIYTGKDTGDTYAKGIGILITYSNYITGIVMFDSSKTNVSQNPPNEDVQLNDVVIDNSIGDNYYCTLINVSQKNNNSVNGITNKVVKISDLVT